MAGVVRDQAQDNEQGGEGVAFTLTKPVRLDQLQAELVTASNVNDPITLSANGDPSTASGANPIELWVISAVLADQVTLDTIDAHVPNPAWVADASTTTTITDVQAAINSGAVLTNMQIATGLSWCIDQINRLANPA